MKYRCPHCGETLRRLWTTKELKYLRESFATTATDVLADKLGRTYSSVAQQASDMGLTKDPTYRLEARQRGQRERQLIARLSQ